jgi:hypothetical protein
MEVEQNKSILTHAALTENTIWGGHLKHNKLMDEESVLYTCHANPSRFIESPKLEDVFAEVTAGVSFRGVGRAHRRMAVLCLINACFEAIHTKPEEHVAVLWPTGTNASKESGELFSAKARKPAVDHLVEHGYIEFKKGGKNASGFTPGVVSLVMPTEKLYLLYRSMAGEDFCVKQHKKANRELIVLKGRNKKVMALEDTEQICKWRNHLLEMNQVNRTHKWSYTNKDGNSVALSPWDLTLQRVFLEGSLTTYGRIHCVAQSLGKDQRRSLMIDGEQTTEFDYAGMQVALAYGESGKQGIDISSYDPTSDPYALPGYDRATVKQVVSIAFNCDSRLKTIQTLRRKKLEDLAGGKGNPAINGILDAIIQQHPVLQPYIFSDAWRTLNYAESTIMMELLNHCRGFGVPVLPVHDCLICRVSDHYKAAQFMSRVFEMEYGFKPRICETQTASGESTVVDVDEMR